MRNTNQDWVEERHEEVLGTFGEAHLIRCEGRVYLRGGSMSDRMEALEWMSLFMPEAVLCVER